MIITGVEIIPFSLPLVRPHVTALGTVTRSRKVLVKISTDEWITGFGEASAYPEYGGGSLEVIATALEASAKVLVGEDPFDTQALMARLLRSGGTVPIARAAIDVALHDLIGQALSQPVSTFFGGRLRDRLEVFFMLAGATPEEVAEDAVRAWDAGYRTVKLKAGFEPIGRTLDKVRAIREGVGGSLAITVDVNQGWEVNEAIDGIHRMAALGVESVEQPVASRDLAGMATVTRSADVRIVADESVWNLNDALEIVKRRAANSLSVRISKAGGLREARNMLDLAHVAGLSCILGSTLESSIGIAAAVQLGVSAPCRLDASALSHHLMFASPLVHSPLVMERGELLVPEGSGLGIQVDEEAVADFQDDPMAGCRSI